jgi:hypothetical protein
MDGGLVLVLQAARLDRETTRKIQQLLQACKADFNYSMTVKEIRVVDRLRG